jgi:hypothetical protein
MKKYIDPPEGWKYGFPKELPDGVEDLEKWFVENGYPRSVIEKYGNYFFYRIFWDE